MRAGAGVRRRAPGHLVALHRRRQVLQQHRELHDQLAAAREPLAGSDPPDGARRSAARAALECLRAHLADHFAREEAGGYLEESITRMPRLSAAMRAVLGEHAGLLAEIDRLIEAVGRPDNDARSWAQASRAFDTFAAHLLTHERNENAVVQEGYNEDLGLVD